MAARPDSRLRVYKGKPFARFARKARISDVDLWEAAKRANEGLVDADLGGGVVKQRIAREGEGKSGGSRSILLLKKDSRAIFVFGFEKKDRDNIDRKELEAFRALATALMAHDDSAMEMQVRDGALLEIENPEGQCAKKISQ